MEKVNLDVMKPWITTRVTELLGFEDDVVIDFVFNMLENQQVTRDLHVDLVFNASGRAQECYRRGAYKTRENTCECAVNE